MKLSKRNKTLLTIIGISIVMFVAILNLGSIFKVLKSGFALAQPVLVGCAIAFILNVFLKFFEDRVFRRLQGPQHKIWNKIHRPVCIVLTLLVVLGIILVVIRLILPELVETINTLADNIPSYIKQIQTWIEQAMGALNISEATFADVEIDWNKLSSMVVDFLKNGSAQVLTTTVTITSSIFSTVVNFFMSVIFGIYILGQKEKLGRQLKQILFAYLPNAKAARTLEIGRLSNRIFSAFVSGQLTEAVIIGVLCFFGMTIFRMPYAPLGAVLVGFTALIPIFGAFIGTAIGAFLILMVSPIKAFWFVIFIIVLQQVEGNLIYPRVVGTSVGLPGIWVLAAIIIGGGAFGMIGMLISVPIASVLYCLIRESVGKRLKRKSMSPDVLKEIGQNGGKQNESDASVS